MKYILSSLDLRDCEPYSVTFLYSQLFLILSSATSSIMVIRTIEACQIHYSLDSLYKRILIGFYQTIIFFLFLLLVLTPIHSMYIVLRISELYLRQDTN
jgi:hypothetical protein